MRCFMAMVLLLVSGSLCAQLPPGLLFQNSFEGEGLCWDDANSCVIGDACYTAGQENPDNSCQICTPATSTTVWSNSSNGTSCLLEPDGGTCQNGTCTASGGPCDFCCANTANQCPLIAYCSSKPCVNATCGALFCDSPEAPAVSLDKSTNQ
jgi:hypothetical protein